MVVILPEGKIDARSSEELGRRIDETVDKGRTRLVVSFENVEYISSSGLRVLLSALKRLREGEGDLKLACMKPYVREVFEIAGFTQLFEIYPEYTEAVRGFEKS